jgi:hypothetical protein
LFAEWKGFSLTSSSVPHIRYAGPAPRLTVHLATTNKKKSISDKSSIKTIHHFALQPSIYQNTFQLIPVVNSTHVLAKRHHPTEAVKERL